MHLFGPVLMDLTAAARQGDRIVLLSDYLRRAEAKDAGIALSILAGERPLARPSPQRLRHFALTGLSEHDLDRAKAAGADLLETVCLLFPARQGVNGAPLSALPMLFRPSSAITNDDLADLFAVLPVAERAALGEILSGRAGRLMSVPDIWCALALAFDAEPARVIRMWFAGEAPYPDLLTGLRAGRHPSDLVERLLPRQFHPVVECEATDIRSNTGDWFFAEETVGHRVQIVTGPPPMIVDVDGRRLTDKFPEIVNDVKNCAAALLEGMIVPAEDSNDPGKSLSKRLSARNCTAALIRQHPVLFQAHDLWQHQENDLSSEVFADRKSALENWLAIHRPGRIALWPCRRGVPPVRAGLLVRDGNQSDTICRTISPRQTAHGVLLYVKTERGRAITGLTLGVKEGDNLVPIGEVKPVFDDTEHRQLLNWARQNAREKFGPVISVPAEYVVEFSFRSILTAPRRKAGIQLVGMTFSKLCNPSALNLVPDVSMLIELRD